MLLPAARRAGAALAGPQKPKCHLYLQRAKLSTFPIAMQPTIGQTLPCPHCGYDLRAIASERCPECGEPIDRDAARRSQIPWAHRRQIGWWRAYWRTVALVLLHPKKLAAEIARPVSYRDAQVFRCITILATSVPFGLIFVAWWRSADASERRHLTEAVPPLQCLTDSLQNMWGLLIIAASLVAMLITLTGIQSYFFHPRSLPTVAQNRAVAISYYAGGILSPSLWLFACSWTCALAQQRFWRIADPLALVINVLAIVTVGGAGILLIAYLVRTTNLLRAIAPGGRARSELLVITMTLVPPLSGALVICLPRIAYWMWLIVR
jgi:hypothetical protein